RNARQHNLKGLDLELPRRSLIVLTGPSGSGKSSLAFDTIYAEGQRRYVESLSTYAKQFLERMEKPAVDLVEGISPAVAIEQKNPTKTSRSTVGTATEVHDYLRLLWARVGRTHCPECDREVRPDTVQSATDRVLRLPEGARMVVAFPLPRSTRAGHAAIVENLRALGFVRVLVDGDMRDLDDASAADPASFGADLSEVPELLVVVDRLVVDEGVQERLADSLATAFAEGEGEAMVLVRAETSSPEEEQAGDADDPPLAPDPGLPGWRVLRFTERFRCPDHPEVRFLDPSPRLFSFNNPYGSCPICTGFGANLEYDEALIVPDHGRSLRDGAVDPWSKPRYKKERKRLAELAKAEGVAMTRPWSELPEAFRAVVLHGRRKKGDDAAFKGVIPFLHSREKKRYKQYIRVFLRQYQTPRTCTECGGGRLRREALWVRVAGRGMAEVTALPVSDALAWVDGLHLEGFAGEVAAPIRRELLARLRFLDDVGLGYLGLDRQTRTLSGGEAQRIALANSLGASLVDTLYVLDEPTIGLHPRDTDRLLALLRRLRDAGNTVLVVEHDPLAIREADHVVELGPGSGEKGGELVFQGTCDALMDADTVTGRYLSGRSAIPVPESRRGVAGLRLRLEGARLHNLADVDVEVPLGALTVVTGVSGSGKSTLVHDVLYRGLERELGGESTAKEYLGEPVGRYRRLDGTAHLDAVVLVDQSPIGRTPRSNPVTYIKAFDHVRQLFAEQPLAKQRGYTPGHFSFNVKGGRCEECKGDGVMQVEMVFMADVYVPCDACGGARFKPETLEVKVKGLSIREVLDLTVDEAIRFFIKQDRLGQALWQLQQVGLGYLRLGQSATTLSGGEAQRLKIARELAGVAGRRGRRLYILDEPTTGLAGEDVRKLIRVLERLLDAGHTVVVIEHNLELIKSADWIIDMGPDAGPGGGRVVAMGTPEQVAGEADSRTAAYLQAALSAPEAALR
ncbi:MAG TPA: excinuclease ABC subunit UvrA, partial [Longimicrobiales bacterium]|nr:excinuclease ABC subunit UvrA [Longimicrobiales bacterium]